MALVFLVPDTFGSHLRDQQGRVWLDESALAESGLTRLSAGSQVEPESVIAATYGPIVEKLEEEQHEVSAFDYDWRLASTENSARLRAELQAAVADPARDVHVIAHGAGGLVAIDAVNDPDLIAALVQRNARLVTLGTPFGGSWDVARMIAGSHPLPRMIAQMSGQDASTVGQIIGGWPGLQECLPKRPPAVPPAVLPILRTVCGTGVPTPAADAVDNKGHSRFLYRAAGDGRVLAADATAAGAPTVVLSATHAELISIPAIKAWLDLLTSAAIVTPPPAPPGAGREPLGAREEPIPNVINSVDLLEAASGALAGKIAVVFPLRVSVAHGHLRQARFPVAVGHYRGDTIVNAEAAIDAALDGRLSRRLDLDMYPGPRGTLEIVRDPNAHPPGAIVIGLGEVGDLTPQVLTGLFSQAAIRHAIQTAESPGSSSGWRSAGISALLIGSDGGGSVTLTDSIRSIVRGVLDANRKLRATKLWERVRIDRLEFIELFEEIAVKAAHVVEELPAALEAELTRGEEISANPQMDVQPGGEFLRPPESIYGGGWWRRVQIEAAESKPASAPPPAEPPASGTLELVYTPLSDRARLQQSTSLQSLEQVSNLVNAAMTQPAMDLKLSNALFELLVPPRLKEGLRQEGDLVLLVNSAAARYPFELMAHRTRDDLVPLIKNTGMLRQLKGIEETQSVELNAGREVLVIGPPDVRGWRPLPGARNEADRVATICGLHGYSPTLLLDASSKDVQTTVFSSDPRILHIAAHGQYSKDPFKSGVVIGDGEYLTTAHVRAMRTVPELVFLNCCHLGYMGATSSSPQQVLPREGYPGLAASLAEGFMAAGVRAVIAAGWAVDDTASLTFARAFYDSFLDGNPFGEAVKHARNHTHVTHPDTNTWGAYQCYGSPEYRLRTPTSAPQRRKTKPPVSRGELVAAVRSLAGRAGGAQGAELAAIRDEFKLRAEQVESGRWKDGQTLAELAAVAAELEDFESAIELYKKALNFTKALAPLTAVEQLANILSRHAPRLAVPKDSQAAGPAIKLFEEAVAWLDWLDTKLEKSAERLALRGALHKRWAMLTGGRERRKHLREAAESYREAHDQSTKVAYQLLNWLAFRYLLEPRKRHPEVAARAAEELTRVQQKLADNREPTFWDQIAIPDALLHVALFEGRITDPERALQVTTAYQNALKTGPSARERASVRDHLQFLVEMLSDPDYTRQSAPRGALQPFLDALA